MEGQRPRIHDGVSFNELTVPQKLVRERQLSRLRILKGHVADMSDAVTVLDAGGLTENKYKIQEAKLRHAEGEYERIVFPDGRGRHEGVIKKLGSGLLIMYRKSWPRRTGAVDSALEEVA